MVTHIAGLLSILLPIALGVLFLIIARPGAHGIRRRAPLVAAIVAALSLTGPAFAADPAPAIRITDLTPANGVTVLSGPYIGVWAFVEAADGVGLVNNQPDVTFTIDGKAIRSEAFVGSKPPRVGYGTYYGFTPGPHTLVVTARSAKGETARAEARFTASETPAAQVSRLDPYVGDPVTVGRDVTISGLVETDAGVAIANGEPDLTVTVDGMPTNPEYVVGSKGLNVAFRLSHVFGQEGDHTVSITTRTVGGDRAQETTYRSAQVAYDCEYRLGFAELNRHLSPGQTGRCTANEYVDPVTGDTLQPTTGWKGQGGLFVYRKSDGVLAYTDGYRTWVLGPKGLEAPRLNTERYPWEEERLWPRARREDTYRLPIGPNDADVAFTLTDGRATFVAVVAPDAPRGTVTLPDSFVWYCDFDGNGYRDAIIVLAVNRLGPGNLIYAVPVRDVNGQAVQLGYELLGDRVVVQSVGIGTGEFHVDMLTQGPNDLASNPTQRVERSFAVKLPR